MVSIEAAVLREYGDLSVESIELADPRAGEVLVDIAACGVCHTDYNLYEGDLNVPLPIVLGHEGAGTVAAVGDGVGRVEPGDRVVLNLLPSCGHCQLCASGRPYLCQRAQDVRFEGTLANGARRLHDGEETINHFYAQSSFASDAVVGEESVVPLREDIPLETAAAFGCGATTGIGAILNTAGVDAGDRVAVFGCGNTGMSAVMAAVTAGATSVIAVDVDEHAREVAIECGASTAIDPNDEGPVERIQEHGGVEYAFEFVGHSDEVRKQAIDSVNQGGTVVFSGAVSEDSSIRLGPVMGGGKTIHSNIAGSARPLVDIPRYATMEANGDLQLSSVIDESYELSDVERALDDLGTGSTIKPVICCP